MCSAPKVKIPKPRRVAPVPPPEPTADKVQAPSAVKAKRKASANLGVSQLQNALRVPSNLSIPR